MKLEGATLPPRLADLAQPPRELFLRGTLPRGPIVALVGTRSPSLDGYLYARHLAGVLALHGVAIASGGAVGIDTAAHEGALDVGGATLVVAPSGFERPFPERNAELYRDIVQKNGGYLSIVADDVPAFQPAFFARNRLLVALAHAVVMVQAPWRSGARNATKHARRLGRPVFVVAHPPWSHRGAGWLTEVELGARPLGSPKDILRCLADQRLYPLSHPGTHPPSAPVELPWRTEASPDELTHPAEIPPELPSRRADRPNRT